MTLEPIHYFRFRNNVSVWAVSAACLILVSAGCKSGASFSKPSWWAFGGNTDPSQLASAPPYENEESSGGTGVSKPSAMASPYPTTTTPESYVMAGEAPRSSSSSPSGSVSQLPQYPSTDDATPITYGQSNPPMSYPETGEIANVNESIQTPAGVSAQTGPYATLPVESSANGPSVAFDQAPAATPSRIADSRDSSSFGDPVSPGFANPNSPPNVSSQPQSPTNPSESRYSETNSSRFGGSSIPEAAGASLMPSAVEQQGPVPGQFEQDPVAPEPRPTDSLVPSPVSSPPPPRRRPDPGYRPGGTSSYTPSSSILVGEPKSDSGVETAGFEKQSQPIR